MSLTVNGPVLPPDEMLWTAREVASYLRASVSWVYKAAERGELPCIRLGAMLRFDPSVIRAWLTARIIPLPTDGNSE